MFQYLATPPCCQTKTVTNAPAGNENLNGEYVLKEAAGDKPHENCADGCVYMKDDEEYCFMNVPIDQAAEIECDATSGGPDGGEGTSPQAGPTGTGAGETAGPGAPTSGSGSEGRSEKTQELQRKKCERPSESHQKQETSLQRTHRRS